eukprot:UN30278
MLGHLLARVMDNFYLYNVLRMNLVQVLTFPFCGLVRQEILKTFERKKNTATKSLEPTKFLDNSVKLTYAVTRKLNKLENALIEVMPNQKREFHLKFDKILNPALDSLIFQIRNRFRKFFLAEFWKKFSINLVNNEDKKMVESIKTGKYRSYMDEVISIIDKRHQELYKKLENKFGKSTTKSTDLNYRRVYFINLFQKLKGKTHNLKNIIIFVHLIYQKLYLMLV